jgi:hypothetical protein
MHKIPHHILSHIFRSMIMIVPMLIAYPFTLHACWFAEDSTRDGPWVSIGIGGATHRFAASVDIAYPINFQFFSAHFIYMAEVTSAVFPVSEQYPPPANKDIEYDLLYGVRLSAGFTLLSLSTGVSIVQSLHVSEYYLQNINYLRPIYQRENIVSAGIPVEMRLAFPVGYHIGWGVTYFANFNRHYSYDGGLFSILYRFR